MAAITAAAYLENGGLSYTADILRRVTKALRPGPSALAGGVLKTGDMQVTQNGTPNMSVNVAAGDVLVDGTQNAATQGTYGGTNDATANLSIAAADPTNPRIDIVVAQFEDSVYSGANNDFKLAVVTGTPAPSPSAPATPANALVLAQVAVAANAASITNANITDKRTFVAQDFTPGPNGLTVLDSTLAFSNLVVADSGLVTLRNALSIPPSQNGTLAGTNYGTVPVKIAQTDTTGAPVASVTYSSIPQGFRDLRYRFRARDTGPGTGGDGLDVQCDGDTTAVYDSMQWFVADNAATFPGAAGFIGQTTARLGAVVQGAAADAGSYSHGEFTWFDYATAHEQQALWECTQMTGTTAGATGRFLGHGRYRPAVAAAITSLKVFCHTTANNIKIVAELEGIP